MSVNRKECYGTEQMHLKGCARCPFISDCDEVDRDIEGAVAIVSETDGIPYLCFGSTKEKQATMGCLECLFLTECCYGQRWGDVDAQQEEMVTEGCE